MKIFIVINNQTLTNIKDKYLREWKIKEEKCTIGKTLKKNNIFPLNQI